MPRRARCGRASTAASPGGARSATTVYTDWRRGSYWRAVRSVTGATARLGIEADHLTLAAERACRKALGAGELVDIAPDMMRLRMVKSPAEIALIREGARIADIGGRARRSGSSAPTPPLTNSASRPSGRARHARASARRSTGSWTARGSCGSAPSGTATRSACSATTTGGRPGWNSARTSTRSWSPAW